MSVRRDTDRIVLDGACPVEDAETLASLLLAEPGLPVDWTACGRLHTAVVQVLLRLAPPLRGPCGDPFVARWVGSLAKQGTPDGAVD